MALSILLVEPDPNSREGLRSLLEAAGHEVGVAEDLAGAFMQLFSGPFDLLVLDTDRAPRREASVTVFDLLRLARKVYRPQPCGILVTSSVEDLPRDLPSQGVFAVLEKPVDLARLRQQLEAAEARLTQRTNAVTGS
ncbi:MAG: response regulator [Candidatus Rokubacteria bacterium]|nr:response regulator [Candidatus Rokubacteria bacterium]